MFKDFTDEFTMEGVQLDCEDRYIILFSKVKYGDESCSCPFCCLLWQLLLETLGTLSFDM